MADNNQTIKHLFKPMKGGYLGDGHYAFIFKGLLFILNSFTKLVSIGHTIQIIGFGRYIGQEQRNRCNEIYTFRREASCSIGIWDIYVFGGD